MSLPDNRIRFPAPKINFESDVGFVGGEHENYPAPGQARFDWMRMYLIGLLSNQSSFDEPTERRPGTIWLDLNTVSLKICLLADDGSLYWTPLSQALAVPSSIGTESFAEWAARIELRMTGAAPEASFNGVAATDNATEIPVPTSLQDHVDLQKHHPWVWVNGILLDTRYTRFVTVASIELAEDAGMSNGDTFTVLIKNITSALMPLETINAHNPLGG